jgi:hypothetical protein
VEKGRGPPAAVSQAGEFALASRTVAGAATYIVRRTNRILREAPRQYPGEKKLKTRSALPREALMHLARKRLATAEYGSTAGLCLEKSERFLFEVLPIAARSVNSWAGEHSFRMKLILSAVIRQAAVRKESSMFASRAAAKGLVSPVPLGRSAT